MSTGQIRLMCARTYRLLDQDHPPAGAWERYECLVDELRRREHAALSPSTPPTKPFLQDRAAFYDNASSSRFELYHDGAPAAYAAYDRVSGSVVIRQVAAAPAFQGVGAENMLLRGVVLHTHQQRLGLVPLCPVAKNFFDTYPQFLAFLTLPQREALTSPHLSAPSLTPSPSRPVLITRNHSTGTDNDRD